MKIESPFDSLPADFDIDGFIKWMKRKLIWEELKLAFLGLPLVVINTWLMLQGIVNEKPVLAIMSLVGIGFAAFGCTHNYTTITKQRRVISMALDKKHEIAGT